MMISKTAHDIKHRKKPNDVFYTPDALARLCVDFVPWEKGDVLCDPAYGEGAFHQFMPEGAHWCELDKGVDFLQEHGFEADWYITNPPYSKLDAWLDRSTKARKGFAYLLGWNNLTARRIERMEKAGFGLTKIKMFKVFRWFGMSCLCVWERGKRGILSYDRTVWREDDPKAGKGEE